MAALFDNAVLSVEASDADSPVDPAFVPTVASAVPVAVASVPIEVAFFLTEVFALSVEASHPIVDALLLVEVVVVPIAAFAPSAVDAAAAIVGVAPFA